jgi:RimJ/RimL family protein N-acetyltransferase
MNEITIKTPRLIIRHFREDDADDLFEMLSNRDVYRFEPGSPISRDHASQRALECSQDPAFWAVVLQGDQKMVGRLYFNQVDPKHLLTWELGYIFNPAYHNQGYASESALALIQYGFTQWDVHRVVAYCSPQNIPSWRVMEKIGMRREGILRQNIFFREDENGNPAWQDSFAYGMLKEDLEFGRRNTE